MSSIVLVTGGAGFIGSHVVDRLAAAGHRPRILDTRASPWHEPEDVEVVVGDVRRLDDVLRAARGCAAICHLAAAADVGEVHARPAWATELNATGTLNALETARRLEIARVVYASTVWVYSDVDADEVDEDELLPAPAHLYTAGKLTGELFCRSYAELYGVGSTILRFGIPYGPRARPAAVIPSFVDRALRGEPLEIAGDGAQERSFVYVEDLAEGVVRALRPRAEGRTYNLVSAETTTIRGLAEIVCEEVAPTAIVHKPGRAGDLRGARVRSDRAATELGWTASTPVREGVRRYAAWVRAQEQPAAPAPARTASARTRTARLRAGLVAATRDPVFAGVIALIAVASAAVAVILGAPDRTDAADFTVAGVLLMLPLSTLTMTPWPADARRAQSAVAVATGVVGVLVLGVLSRDHDVQADFRGRVVLPLVLFVAGLSWLARVVPRRYADGVADRGA